MQTTIDKKNRINHSYAIFHFIYSYVYQWYIDIIENQYVNNHLPKTKNKYHYIYIYILSIDNMIIWL